MEKITKEDLMKQIGCKDSLELGPEKNAVGDGSDSSIKKCMDKCMKIHSNYDLCRLQCTYDVKI